MANRLTRGEAAIDPVELRTCHWLSISVLRDTAPVQPRPVS
jgi:hypothetical protein